MTTLRFPTDADRERIYQTAVQQLKADQQQKPLLRVDPSNKLSWAPYAVSV